jgi:hypothetical protein
MSMPHPLGWVKDQFESGQQVVAGNADSLHPAPSILLKSSESKRTHNHTYYTTDLSNVAALGLSLFVLF